MTALETTVGDFGNRALDAAALDRVLEALLAENFGYCWSHPDGDRDIGAALRASYSLLIDAFRAFPAPLYHTDEEAIAYALGYMPRNIVKAERILQRSGWARRGVGERRILDLGVGPGTISLAALDAVGGAATPSEQGGVAVTIVDYSPAMLRAAARVLASLRDGDGATLRGVHLASVEAHNLDFRASETLQLLSVGQGYDLIAFGNCLSEVCDPAFPPSLWSVSVAALVSAYANLLSAHGQIVVLEPALNDVRPGIAEAQAILTGHSGLRCVAWSKFERLPDSPESLTSALSRSVLGDGTLRALEKGSPYSYMVFERTDRNGLR